MLPLTSYISVSSLCSLSLPPTYPPQGALPAFLRRMSATLKKHTGRPLPLSCAPVTFASWMGGDRDGNPNVTSKTTVDVSALSRWMAADLYLREVDALRFELSMTRASQELIDAARELECDPLDEAAQSASGGGGGVDAHGHAVTPSRPARTVREPEEFDHSSLNTPLAPVRRVRPLQSSEMNEY